MFNQQLKNQQLEVIANQNQEIQSGDISAVQVPVEEIGIPTYGVAAVPLEMMLIAWAVLFF